MKKCLVFIIFLFFLIPVQTLGAPESYIDETVNSEFYMNGTMKTEPVKIGYASVSIGNNNDVLQYIEINLSWNDRTNLEIIPGTEGNERARSHRATAASPVTGDEKTRLYLNTTDSNEALYYIINDSVAPVINLSMSYVNEDGGIDIHSSLNILNFTINLTSNSNLPGADFHFQVTEDMGGNDAMNIINPNATSFNSLEREDTDSDGIFDRLNWNGDLITGEVVTINFEGQIETDINFDSSLYTSFDLGGDCEAIYLQDTTFSGISFENRFSRGPIREGIDLIQEANWSVQGFIKNMAHGIDYFVEGWEIYEVGETTPMASSSDTFLLEPDEVIYTTKHDTGQSNKKYYSSSFNWRIVWGNSYYSGQSTNEIDMPFLYLIDSTIDKTVNIDQNEESGRILSIQDTVGHIGDSSLNVNLIHVNSTIPHLSQEGHATSWSISDIQVLYRSGGGETDITGSVNILSSGSTSSEDGYLNATVTSVDLGKSMQVGDEIVLRYKISSSSHSQYSSYFFGLETILVTESGTPDYKQLTDLTGILGIEVPPGGGGGGPTKDDAWIQKEDARAHVIVGNLANVKVIYRIYDTGDKGIRDTGLMVLIPEYGKLLKERTDIDIMINDEWKKLTQNQDYRINYGGIVSVGNKNYNQYIVDFLLGDGGMNLYGGDKIKIEYKTELPYGLNELITEASGYNYYDDKIVTESVHSLIRIGVKVSKFKYIQDEWVQGIALVGRPVTWLKEFRIKNPNDVPAEDSFVTKVFRDALSAYVVTEDGEKRELNIMPDNKVSWGVKMEAQEEKNVYLQVITPPVIEILKTVTPLFSNETWVNFDMNSTVKNFAEETYKNVTYALPYPIENVIAYEGLEGLLPDGDDTLAIVGDMKSFVNESFYIRYIQKPPILIVTTNGFNFTNAGTLEVKIIVIPTEKEEMGYLELETMGPVEKTNKLIYGDMMNVEGRKGSINEFQRLIGLDNLAPGKYKIITNFKKDFVTVLRDEKEFNIGGEGLFFEIGYNLLILLFVAFAWFTFTRVERKKDKFKEELRKMGRNEEKKNIFKSKLRKIREKLKGLRRKTREKKDIYQSDNNI